MAIHGGTFDVIKVVRQSLQHGVGETPRVGDRIVMVALYYGDMNKAKWDDFIPSAVSCGTNDATIPANRLQQLEEEDWKTLEMGLKRLGPNPKEGLHWL
ncbi:MAG: DUF3239 domain-containing protein [Phycisphaerales bacterium]|nr:DUF3239 domain-containing protein [Phycisphaerales bacterium]